MEQKFCQSCGMPLTNEVLGTNADGSKNEDYCMTFFLDSIIPVIITAVFATFAAVQEGHFIRTGVEKPRSRMGNRQA